MIQHVLFGRESSAASIADPRFLSCVDLRALQSHCNQKGGKQKILVFNCPGRIFSYCVQARAYTHVLARVYKVYVLAHV